MQMDTGSSPPHHRIGKGAINVQWEVAGGNEQEQERPWAHCRPVTPFCLETASLGAPFCETLTDQNQEDPLTRGWRRTARQTVVPRTRRRQGQRPVVGTMTARAPSTGDGFGHGVEWSSFDREWCGSQRRKACVFTRLLFEVSDSTRKTIEITIRSCPVLSSFPFFPFLAILPFRPVTAFCWCRGCRRPVR